MELFSAVFVKTLELFQTPFSLFGFGLSFWEVFLWVAVAGIIIEVLRRFFFDD